ncbi:MAG: hypothetical protein A2V66_10770 [Ignavibacteria bacterium RBG_13_36_8]|nr:MAG: hypothetical protein A2V66_10770 [Ignavibacteria bacterium RBG_13_36_8]
MPRGFFNSLKQSSEYYRTHDIRIGNLIYFKGEGKQALKFQGSDSQLLDLDYVHFLTSEWNYENGYKNLPKPYVIENEVIVDHGDDLAYTYIDEESKNILILGSILNLKSDVLDKNLCTDIDNYDNLREKHLSRNNPQRYFSVFEDGKGNISIYLLGKNGEEPGAGNLGVKIEGTEGSGNVNIMFNGKLALTRYSKNEDSEELTDQILLEEGKIKLIDKNKNRIELTENAVNVYAKKNCEVTAEENCNLNAKIVKVTKDEFIVEGLATPDGSGAFCGLKNCVFSGALHTSDTIKE